MWIFLQRFLVFLRNYSDIIIIIIFIFIFFLKKTESFFTQETPYEKNGSYTINLNLGLLFKLMKRKIRIIRKHSRRFEIKVRLTKLFFSLYSAPSERLEANVQERRSFLFALDNNLNDPQL